MLLIVRLVGFVVSWCHQVGNGVESVADSGRAVQRRGSRFLCS